MKNNINKKLKIKIHQADILALGMTEENLGNMIKFNRKPSGE